MLGRASPDPFAGLAAAFTRRDAQGQPFGGWHPEEAVSREKALAAFTADGAYAGFAEGRFGRLVEGERADFVVIDRDLLLASPEELRETRVVETWVGFNSPIMVPLFTPMATPALYRFHHGCVV